MFCGCVYFWLLLDRRMSLLCCDCQKSYSTQYNLNKHLRTIHNKQSKYIEYDSEKKYMCITCNVYFNFNNDLRKHLEINHSFENIVETFNFENFEAFSQWLSQEENNNKVQYAKHSGKKKGVHGKEKLYYECMRSYKKPSVLKHNRKRQMKSQGSCKLPKSCASQIIVTRDVISDECSVIYYKSHYLHDHDIEHMHVSKSDKDEIASKLILGVSSKSILQKIRETVGEDLKRTDFITSTDIRNIKRAYKIDLKDDATSVNFWTKECEKGNNNYIIINSKEEYISCGNDTTKENDEEKLQQLIPELSNNDNLKEKLRSNLLQLLQVVDNVETLSEEKLKLMVQHTDICLALESIKEGDKFAVKDNSLKRPTNTKITKQVSFFSTKKKRSPHKAVYSKPSSELRILKEFVNEDLIVSSNADYDHKYCQL